MGNGHLRTKMMNNLFQNENKLRIIPQNPLMIPNSQERITVHKIAD